MIKSKLGVRADLGKITYNTLITEMIHHVGGGSYWQNSEETNGMRSPSRSTSINRPTNTTDKVVDDDGGSSSSKSIMPLYSRNMILMNAISAISFGLGENFKEDFIRTHPYDNFMQFAEQLRARGDGIKKAIVFTYSSSWELKELLANNANYKVNDASFLHQKGLSERQTFMREILSEPLVTLVVQFNKKSEWEYAQQIRHNIDNAKFNIAGKSIIFVAHYAPEDIRTEILVDTSISYFTRDWEMAVVDDIHGCSNEEFFEVLDQKCVAVLNSNTFFSNKSHSTATSLARELVSEALKHYLIQMLPNSDYRNFAKGSRIYEMFSSQPDLLDYICNHALENSKVNSDKTVKELFSKQECRTLFDDFLDAAQLVKFKIKEYFLSVIIKDIQTYDQVVSFSIISLVGLCSRRTAEVH